jgi:hypothetical protein
MPGAIKRLFWRLDVAGRVKSQRRAMATAFSPREQIASIHHLACTGGTIISKCIASMRGVYLLSEIHPFRTNSPQFDPMAVTAQFQAQYGALSSTEMKSAFLAQMAIVGECVKRRGGHLVLRDHAHTDFCAEGGALAPTMLATLSESGYRTNAAVTIRDPVESYISMLNNGWRELGFDSYCERWLAFLDCYGDRPIHRYEDFCNDPEKEIIGICNDLQIPFDPNFRNGIAKQRLTGDSGRRSDDIGVRAAKPIPPELLREINSSPAYFKILKSRPEYERDLR